MNITIRQLKVDDAPAYRNIRLEALKAFPTAYGTTYAETLARPENSFQKTILSNTMLGIYTDDTLSGIASFVTSDGIQSRHTGHIHQMYISARYHGQGLGLKLLTAVIEHARTLVKQIYLGVGTENQAALALYKRAGFEIYGTEPRALLVNGHYIDEHLMVKFLDTKDISI